MLLQFWQMHSHICYSFQVSNKRVLIRSICYNRTDVASIWHKCNYFRNPIMLDNQDPFQTWFNFFTMIWKVWTKIKWMKIKMIDTEDRWIKRVKSKLTSNIIFRSRSRNNWYWKLKRKRKDILWKIYGVQKMTTYVCSGTPKYNCKPCPRARNIF